MVDDPGNAAHPPEGGADLHATALELLNIGQQIMRMKLAPRIGDASRGMPVVMRALVEAKGPLSPGELARICGVSDARIANTLRVLEQRGYVERHTSQADRRRVEVVATQAGMELARQRVEEGIALVERFLAEMGEDDARDFVRVLGRVRDVMAKRREEGRHAQPPEM